MENQNRNNGLIWLIGGVLILLIFGCSLTVAASYLAVRQNTASAPRAAEARPVVDTDDVVLRPTPAPVIRIATPEAGLDYESAVYANLYNQVNPSVVNVTILGSASAIHSLLPEAVTPGNTDPEDLFSFGSGSGFVWDAEGHIVTNNHVVAGGEEVQITFADGRMALATIVGADVDSDLAVLKIDPEGYDLRPIARGAIDDVFVGMRVAAIGNPFGLEGTLTTGIVSALGRSIPARNRYSIPDAIQTDAAINPGNSGGPLLNEQGALIGVNAQIRSEERANSGVGFAIPISIVERVVPQLIADGRYQHAYIGISAQTFSPVCSESMGLAKSIRGAVVLEVLPGTPAARAGVRDGTRVVDTRYPDMCPSIAGGDVITAIGAQPVVTFDDVLIYLQRNTAPGDTVALTVLRNGESIVLDVTLAPRPTR